MSAVKKARLAWGDDISPEILALAGLAQETSFRLAAMTLGTSKASVAKLLGNTYHAQTKRMFARIRSKLPERVKAASAVIQRRPRIGDAVDPAFVERMHRVVTALGSNSGAGRACGRNHSQIRNYLLGHASPAYNVVDRLASASGYSLVWLIRGTGPEREGGAS